MPAKLHLPEKDIVARWLSDLSATTNSLGAEYNCSYATITAILSRHLDKDEIKKTKCAKISRSAKLSDHYRTPERLRAFIKSGSASQTPEQKRTAILKGVHASAEKRKGQKLSSEHRAKLAVAHLGLNAGSNHCNWRGGTSTKCWRGKGWTVARRITRERDNNTCRICGKTAQEQNRNMDVHHRVSYFDFSIPEQANAVDNLVCLCRSCHRKVENKTALCP